MDFYFIFLCNSWDAAALSHHTKSENVVKNQRFSRTREELGMKDRPGEREERERERKREGGGGSNFLPEGGSHSVPDLSCGRVS
jgi:hypothetical protein